MTSTASVRDFVDVGDGRLGTELAPSGLLMVIAAGEPYEVGVGGRSLVRGRGGFVIGAQSRYGRSRLPGRVEGVQIDLPWQTAARVFGPALADLADTAAAFTDVDAPGVADVADRLAETPPGERTSLVIEWLRVVAASQQQPNPTAVEALRRIEAGVSSVSALAAGLACSRGHLHRIVCAATGQPPSVLLRVARLHRVLGTGSGPWSDRAAAAGYADHPHLCHETRALAGRTPTELFG